MKSLGIDVGGSGIKGAVVDLHTGKLASGRHRIPTPQPATPKAVASTVKALVRHFDWDGPVGCGFPAAIQHGLVRTTANIDRSWLDVDVAGRFAKKTGCRTWVVNDADAAGMAEMTFGAGRGFDRGIVMMVTVGTGLGTAIFNDGVLLPNTELGHLEVDGSRAELRASDAARKREKLKWKEWAKRFDRYLQVLEDLFWPDLIMIGGGASKKSEKFFPYLNVRAKVVPAELLNEAGIVGAALAARHLL